MQSRIKIQDEARRGFFSRRSIQDSRRGREKRNEIGVMHGGEGENHFMLQFGTRQVMFKYIILPYDNRLFHHSTVLLSFHIRRSLFLITGGHYILQKLGGHYSMFNVQQNTFLGVEQKYSNGGSVEH